MSCSLLKGLCKQVYLHVCKTIKLFFHGYRTHVFTVDATRWYNFLETVSEFKIILISDLILECKINNTKREVVLTIESITLLSKWPWSSWSERA